MKHLRKTCRPLPIHYMRWWTKYFDNDPLWSYKKRRFVTLYPTERIYPFWPPRS